MNTLLIIVAIIISAAGISAILSLNKLPETPNTKIPENIFLLFYFSFLYLIFYGILFFITFALIMFFISLSPNINLTL